MNNLFVHGKLRRDEANHHLIAATTFLGTALTIEQYALCIMGDKAIVTKRPASRIVGEVFEVSDDLLKLVDRSEGHPHVNKRELVQVALQDGTVADAWIYFHVQPLRDAQIVESGDYAARAR
jgi:gamma-glutamylcyclotransferase (GGCT)/AIG2-like uncharacterized protein YtfP